MFSHIKGEWPHLEKIRDPGEPDAELDRVRTEYNTVRLHAGIGYVTPDDEHNGPGDALRQGRRDGLDAARLARLAYRQNQQGRNDEAPGPGWVFIRRPASLTQKHHPQFC